MLTMKDLLFNSAEENISTWEIRTRHALPGSHLNTSYQETDVTIPKSLAIHIESIHFSVDTIFDFRV